MLTVAGFGHAGLVFSQSKVNEKERKLELEGRKKREKKKNNKREEEERNGEG